MKVITVRNVHQALPEGLRTLKLPETVSRESRYGNVLMSPVPVTTHYTHPTERVMFWDSRDANPFFHLMEGLWMIAGRNDVAFVETYAKRMREFSDDGITFHGAYGHRWRGHFDGYDQIKAIIKRLKADPNDRRNVLQMWDPSSDLDRDLKDVPCNTSIYFLINHDGKLDMTIANRSNDIIWGAYGANAVHMSMLQEYMATAIGVPVGNYWQVSNNWHAYEKTLFPIWDLADRADDILRGIDTNPYTNDTMLIEPYPLMQTPVDTWNRDLNMFLEHPDAMGIRDPFFRKVARPMEKAHEAFRTLGAPDRYTEALTCLQGVCALDWQMAACEWIERRYNKWKEKQEKETESDERVI